MLHLQRSVRIGTANLTLRPAWRTYARTHPGGSPKIGPARLLFFRLDPLPARLRGGSL